MIVRYPERPHYKHRRQTWGTFKLLFTSIFYGAALAPTEPAPPIEAAIRPDATTLNGPKFR